MFLFRVRSNLCVVLILIGIGISSTYIYSDGFSETGPIFDERKDVIENSSRGDRVVHGGFSSINPRMNERKDIIKRISDLPFNYISTCVDEKYEQKFDIKVTGFIKYDALIDSYQPISDHLGLDLLVPKKPEFDVNGVDINDTPQWNMLGIQSRFNIDIDGPPLGSARTFGRLMFDILDPINATLVRMRNAYMQFTWQFSDQEVGKLLVGHYYHPVSLDEAFAETLGYSEGVLFDPYDYAAQTTYRFTFKKLTVCGCLNADWRDRPARNAVLPDFFLSMHVEFVPENFVGAGIDFHHEMPRLVTDKGYATNNAIRSWLYYAFCAFKKNGFTAKFRVTYLENGIRYGMLGGYGVKAENYNPVTDLRSYTNLNALAFWTEYIYRYKKAEVGIFIGYSKNKGSHNKLVALPDGTADLSFIDTLYPEAKETDQILKVQPRLVFRLDPIMFGVELEYARAYYGKVDSYGKVFDAKPIDDARVLFAIFYKF